MYYILLIIFGILGALARYSLQLLLYNPDFPLATLMINLLGCFLLAVVTQFLIWVPFLTARTVSAIGTGFVGSFTTFSTFTLETFQLLQTGRYMTAIGYLLISSFGGLAACTLGLQMSKYFLKKGRSVNAR
ncbi:CrcB family protein [Sporolactobacillus shoreicorticis]|uniref:Fluoride-specific ion channel FluC n=1 Tax=Sporolactobacillus shoreicorticis TaxID=1923877 RepID=A0ABW5RZI9_9BACL|nr:CrcB family protein [Sporolactobacillus shoreicorticis]MCO7127246.1 CrcB family protein [Sporolactobacillus shoreicorticis]